MVEPTLITRERLALALDVKASAYMGPVLDRKCASATSAVHGLLNKGHLWPIVKTRYFDWPTSQDASYYRVWFDDETLISATTVLSGGVSIPASAYFLEPQRSGPPYDYLDLDRSSGYAFSALSTPQRAISLAGVWGESNVEESATTLAADATGVATTVTVAAPNVGIGDLIRIDSERLVVTDKSWAVSGQTVLNGSGLLASATDVLLTITSTATFVPGEVLLIDAERLMVRELVSATVLIVQRAVGGSALAAHANASTIRRQSVLTVSRAYGGTTSAAHTTGATVYRWVPPFLAEELALAYAEDALLQGASGYARTTGSGESERPASGQGIRALEKRIVAAMGRQARTRAV